MAFMVVSSQLINSCICQFPFRVWAVKRESYTPNRSANTRKTGSPKPLLAWRHKI
jgi:hypothetical protein